jgi:restriction endonuclease Mrr
MEMRTEFDEVADKMAKTLGLTPQQKFAKTSDQRTTVWKNRIQWVRQHLITKGELDGSERGVWKLTPQGRARAANSEGREIRLVDPA